LAQEFKKKPKPKNTQRRGAPKGHKGAARPTPEPDRVVEVTADQCDLCGGTTLEERGVEKEVIEEIPPPPKIEIIQFNRHKYKCHDCGHEFTAKSKEYPQKGRFGVNLLVYRTMLKFSLRGVLRRIKDFAFHLRHSGCNPSCRRSLQERLFRKSSECQRCRVELYGRNGNAGSR